MQSPEQLANLRPPWTKENRGSGHHKKHPNGYLTPVLKKLLKGKWPANDPKIKALLATLKLPETIGTFLVLRRIMNACEGDDLAIERIFERLDGKVGELEPESAGQDTRIIIINNGSKQADGSNPKGLPEKISI